MFRLAALGAAVLAVVLPLIGLAVWEALPERQKLTQAEEPLAGAGPAFQHLGYLPRLYVAHATRDGRLYGIEDHFLYVSEDGGDSFRRLGALPRATPGFFGWAKDLAARSKLARGLRRNLGPSNVVVLESGTILVFWDRIYRSTDGGLNFEPVFSFAENRLSPPFALSEGVAVTEADEVYFGEYAAEGPNREIHVIKGSDDGRTWSVAHTFASGEIRHIHSMQYDPYRKRLWICTGDTDEESRLHFTDDGFATLEKLGGGSQDWRIVSLMISEDYLHWGSDNPYTGASIFRWNFAEERLEEQAELGKVSYYSTVLADGTLVLSTTLEPRSPYTKAANPSRSTDIWVSYDGETWRQLLSLPYRNQGTETRPSRATIGFPGGHPVERLFFTPLSTVETDFTTQVLRLPRPVSALIGRK